MSTDFSYGGKQIITGGPIKPNGKDMPSDVRTRVETYADIASIPNPYVGLKITVKVDETNNNKMTDYIVKSLKANSMGVANSVIDEVVRYVDYLGVSGGSSGGGSGEGLTTEQAQQLTTAYEHSQSKHVSMDEVNQAIANAQLSGGEVDLSTYATKTYTDNAISTALDGHTFKFLTQAEYDALETKDPLVEYHITDASETDGLTTEQAQQLQTAYEHSQSDHVSMEEVNQAIANIVLESGNISFRDVNDGEIFVISSSEASNIYGNIVLSKSSLSVNEGSTGTFTVKLDQAPTNNQTVRLVVAGRNCTIDKTTLTFTSSNYSTAQTITVTGVADSSSYVNKSDSITLSSSNVSSKTVSVTIVNTDVEKTLSSITAVYNQGDTVIYPDTSLDNLKSNLTVTANYSDSTSSTVTGYTLSGTLSEGSSTVTVSYGGKTTTFNVTVTARPTLSSISAVYTQGDTIIYPTTSLESLKDNLVVTAHYSDDTSSNVSDYELSGNLNVGTSTITVTYQEKTTTFDVTVNEGVISGNDGLVLSYSYDSITKDDSNYKLILNDKTGNGYDTTIQTTASGYPYISYDSYFKGTNGITVTGSNIDLLNNEFTVEYIVKTNNTNGGILFALDDYQLTTNTSATTLKDSNQLYATITTNLTDNSNFKQFVCTVDIANKIGKLYCNGSLVASDTDGSGAKALTNKLFTPLQASPNFHIKTIKVYNKVLTDEEILNNYNNMEV